LNKEKRQENFIDFECFISNVVSVLFHNHIKLLPVTTSVHADTRKWTAIIDLQPPDQYGRKRT